MLCPGWFAIESLKQDSLKCLKFHLLLGENLTSIEKLIIETIRQFLFMHVLRIDKGKINATFPRKSAIVHSTRTLNTTGIRILKSTYGR